MNSKSRRKEIGDKLTPLYEMRDKVTTQLREVKESNDSEAEEIWERLWFAVADEIVALTYSGHTEEEMFYDRDFHAFVMMKQNWSRARNA